MSFLWDKVNCYFLRRLFLYCKVAIASLKTIVEEQEEKLYIKFKTCVKKGDLAPGKNKVLTGDTT